MIDMSMYSNDIQNEICKGLLDFMEGTDYSDMYICDIASYCYNEDYYMIGIYQCRQWVQKYFDDVAEAVEYWVDKTGDNEYYGLIFSDVEKLVSLVAYVICEYIINNICQVLDIDWNDTLDDETYAVMINTLKDWYE